MRGDTNFKGSDSTRVVLLFISILWRSLKLAAMADQPRVVISDPRRNGELRTDSSIKSWSIYKGFKLDNNNKNNQHA